MIQFFLPREEFALSAIARLRRIKKRTAMSRLSESTQTYEDDDAMFEAVPADLLPSDLSEPAPPSECPFVGLVAASLMPAKQLPSAVLLSAFKLAEALGDFAAVAAMIEPGALTLIETGTSETVESTIKALQDGYLQMLPTTENGLDVQVLHPRSLSAPTLADKTNFGKALSEALQSRAPIVVIIPDRSFLPPDAVTLLPQPLRLPAITGALILAIMRQTHGKITKAIASAVLAILQPDDQLRLLAPDALYIALRQPNPEAVAHHIAKTGRHLHTSGPRLDAFDAAVPAVIAVRGLISDLADWKAGQVEWRDMSHSLLLAGSSGSGKTWLARAAAQTAGVPLVAASFADWQKNGNLSAMLAAMDASFKQARDLAPSILLIDEVDSVGTRANRDHNSSYTDQVINGFLTLLDGVISNQGVLIIATTNRPQAIDPAVLRPGRFDKIVEMGPPNLSALRMIVATAGGGLMAAEDIEQIARAAVGCSAASVDGAIREAKTESRRNGTTLNAARVIPRLSTSAPNQRLEHRIAIHEAGHASIVLRYGFNVSHIRLGNGSGEVTRQSCVTEGTLDQFEDEIVIMLAGRAAEQVLLGNISGGAGGPVDSDLARSTQMALDLELRFGMGQYGNIWMPMPIELALRDPELLSIVQTTMDRAYARALADITAIAAVVRDMAAALIEARELNEADLVEWAALLRNNAEAVGKKGVGIVLPFPSA